MQTSLKSHFTLSGVGLHSGRDANLRVGPAREGTGVVFLRSDLSGQESVLPARFDRTEQTALCTRLKNASGESVSTIEHLMAALAGAGVDNAIVEIDGPEVPILDGSALPFFEEIERVGVREMSAARQTVVIRKTVRVEAGDAWAELRPGSGFTLEAEIAFADAAIGRQAYRIEMGAAAFRRELAAARTFCRMADVEAMRAAGLGLGGTMENAVVVEGDKILSPGGLRIEREFVRHKLLDVVGDLALLGMSIEGAFHASRPGHSLTNQLLRKLAATPGAYSIHSVQSLEAA